MERRDENADPFTTVVRGAVMTLRRKLGEPPLVRTVPGARNSVAAMTTGSGRAALDVHPVGCRDLPSQPMLSGALVQHRLHADT
jgi:hypothetical protein